MAHQAAVGIPSYREADTISKVTRQVDAGLSELFPAGNCVIVNVDSNSDDATTQAFLDTATRCEKKVIVVEAEPRGKGHNLLAFFAYCFHEGIDLLVTIDADIRTITPDWVVRLLRPLIEEQADLVFPVYKRNRFEGATTNHFAFPLIAGLYGHSIRQPIGGDMALNGRVASYVCDQEIPPEARGYGIDIFLAIHAIGGGFRATQSPLGRKLHKPSYQKRPKIFVEAAGAAASALRCYEPRGRRSRLAPDPSCCIDASSSFAHRDEAMRSAGELRRALAAELHSYRNWADHQIGSLRQVAEGADVTAELWSSLLAAWVRHAMRPVRPEAARMARELLPLYLLRSLAFWLEAEDASAQAVERKIVAQAREFQQEFWAGKH